MYVSLMKKLEHIVSGKLLGICCGRGDFFGLIKEKGFKLYNIYPDDNIWIISIIKLSKINDWSDVIHV